MSTIRRDIDPFRVIGPDRYFSAVRHGLLGVDHQIENNLFNAIRISLDLPQLPVQIGSEFNVFSDNSSQDLFLVANNVV